jgi:hypothetical protein
VHGLGTQMTLIGRTNTESKMSVVVSEDSTGTRYMNFADGPNQDIFQVAFEALRRGEVLVTVEHTKDAFPVTRKSCWRGSITAGHKTHFQRFDLRRGPAISRYWRRCAGPAVACPAFLRPRHWVANRVL